MAGAPGQNKIVFDGHIERELVRGDFDFTRILLEITGRLEAVHADPPLAKLMMLDDRFYRALALLFSPGLEDADLERARPLRREIARLCEYMRANLTEPINLTKMERISGLSARLLQYAFRRSFGLTPIEWLRRERLHAARRLILDRRRDASITAIALEFGFSPSQFALYYRALFHERPSETRART